MTAKRYPLPKRFNAAMSELAYDKLRALSSEYGFGNNYCLTVLLESLEEIVDAKKLEHAFKSFEAEYGSPKIK